MTPAASRRRGGVGRQLLLVTGVATSPLVVRAALLATQPAPLALVDAVGAASDLAVSLLFAAALAVASRSSRILALGMALAWGLLQYGNYEHVRELGAGLDLAFAAYVFDPTFLSGSVLAPTRPGLLAIAAGAPLLCTALATWADRTQKIDRQSARWWPAVGLAVSFLLVLSLLPGHRETASWRARHFFADMLESAVRAQRAPTPTDTPGSEPTWAAALHAELDGAPLLSLPGRGRNVLLLILEGLPATTLRSLSATAGSNGAIVMPRLSELSNLGLSFENFVLHQKQTNRGVYALLCGDLPKLDRSIAKMTEYTRDSSRSCLPRVLKASDYETVFLQGAPLSFMYKDAFAERAEFDRVYGDRDFSDPILRSYWGVDDASLMRRAAKLVTELSETAAPYFMTVLTAGTHHPYTVPGDSPEHERAGDFPAAIRYLDGAVGDFVDFLESEGHLEETLVILTTDESRGDDALSGIHHDLSRSWGPLIVLTPEQIARRISAPFGQSDVAVSILDYLGLDPHATPFIGRSLFRADTSRRRVHFGNVYLKSVGAVDSAGFLFSCALSLQSCHRYDTTPAHLFLPLGTPAPAPPEFVAEIRDVIEYSRGDVSMPRSFSFALTGQQRVRMEPGVLRMIMDGQNLAVPPGSRIDVEIALGIEGSTGEIRLLHEMLERGKGDLIEIPPVWTQPSRDVEIRYSYITLEALENLKFKLTGRLRGAGDAVVRVDRAVMSVAPNETLAAESGVLEKPLVRLRRAERADPLQ